MSRWKRSSGAPSRSDNPERLDAVIEGLRGERPWRSGLALGELGRRWAEVVGDRLALETRPAALERGLLVVAASSSGWAAQVRFLSDQVRQRANSVLGSAAVQQVKVTIADARGYGISDGII